MTAKAFSSQQYKEMKTNIFHTGKPVSFALPIEVVHERRQHIQHRIWDYRDHSCLQCYTV